MAQQVLDGDAVIDERQVVAEKLTGRRVQRHLSIGKPKQRGGSPLQNVGVRAARFPGEHVKRRQCGHAAGRPRKNALEEAHRIDQRFRPPVRRGHKKRGPPQFVRHIRRGQRLGHVVQTGKRHTIAARVQRRERAIHRRMAQHRLQTLSNGRQYHG